MKMLADSGRGLLESKITKGYFLKLVRIFNDLVRIFLLHFALLCEIILILMPFFISIKKDKSKVPRFCTAQRLLHRMEHSLYNISIFVFSCHFFNVDHFSIRLKRILVENFLQRNIQ